MRLPPFPPLPLKAQPFTRQLARSFARHHRAKIRSAPFTIGHQYRPLIVAITSTARHYRSLAVSRQHDQRSLTILQSYEEEEEEEQGYPYLIYRVANSPISHRIQHPSILHKALGRALLIPSIPSVSSIHRTESNRIKPTQVGSQRPTAFPFHV